MPQEDRFASDATADTVLTEAIADEPLESHERDARISVVVGKFGFEQVHQPVEELSGGWRKRLALAREFIRQPDLLLMDEPTNHLDLEGIAWLEETLLGVRFAFLAVSHDRYFLERVTNRVVELNPVYPDGYFSVSGNYSMFLQKRADFLDAQQAQQVTLTNIVKREVAFLKSHAKARRSKSKSRIDDAYRVQNELRELKQRNDQTAAAGIDFEGTGRRSKKLLAAKRLAKTLGGKLLFKDVSLLLSPGTRLGLLGANGSGKTTLIRVLTGDLSPDEGDVATAENVRIVVFDQKREELPQDVSLRRALAGKDDSVDFRGRNIHISSWAKRFLFRARPARYAGERSLGRGAGADPDRPPDASPGRRSHSRRAHERSGHRIPRRARRELLRIPRRDPIGDARSPHARQRLHGDPGPRRQRACGPVRRLRTLGGGSSTSPRREGGKTLRRPSQRNLRRGPIGIA